MGTAGHKYKHQNIKTWRSSRAYAYAFAALMSSGDMVWTSTHPGGSRNTLSRFMLKEKRDKLRPDEPPGSNIDLTFLCLRFCFLGRPVSSEDLALISVFHCKKSLLILCIIYEDREPLYDYSLENCRIKRQVFIA